MVCIIFVYLIVYLFHSTDIVYPHMIEIREGDIVDYQIEYSIPKCGLVSNGLYKIIQVMEQTSICEVANDIIMKMDYKWSNNYIGCSDNFSSTWNGITNIYFFSSDVGHYVDNQCLTTLATVLDRQIQEVLKTLGVTNNETVRVTMASVKRNVTVCRARIRYTGANLNASIACGTVEESFFKYNSRLMLDNCFKNGVSERQHNTHQITHWLGCQEKYELRSHILVNGPRDHKNMQAMADTLLFCDPEFEAEAELLYMTGSRVRKLNCAMKTDDWTNAGSLHRTAKKSGDDVRITCANASHQFTDVTDEQNASSPMEQGHITGSRNEVVHKYHSFSGFGLSLLLLLQLVIYASDT